MFVLSFLLANKSCAKRASNGLQQALKTLNVDAKLKEA